MDSTKVKKRQRINFIFTGILFLIFILFTIILLTWDRQPIGPNQSIVGLSSLNQFIQNLYGINSSWYKITDWLGITAIGVAFAFSFIGLGQLIKKRNYRQMDPGIIALGVFYIVVASCYALFEILIINYRPILVEESLEASFPSSHTMIIICIMATAIIQFNTLLKNRQLRIAVNLISCLIMFMAIIGRMLSGVHWFTDIIGGILLSAALVMLYYSVLQAINNRKNSVDKLNR